MELLEYFSLPEKQQEVWLEKINQKSWSAAHSLAEHIRNNTFLDRSKGFGRLFLLVDGQELVSFCTLAAADGVESDLYPWIGYVFCDEKYRGYGYPQILIRNVCSFLKRNGVESVYISSGYKDYYRKVGFEPFLFTRAISGYDTWILKKQLH